jgi:hypothetical protein
VGGVVVARYGCAGKFGDCAGYPQAVVFKLLGVDGLIATWGGEAAGEVLLIGGQQVDPEPFGVREKLM